MLLISAFPWALTRRRPLKTSDRRESAAHICQTIRRLANLWFATAATIYRNATKGVNVIYVSKLNNKMEVYFYKIGLDWLHVQIQHS